MSFLASKGLSMQHTIFQRAKRECDAVEASHVVSELTAKVGKSFTEGQFVKDCMAQAANILLPEKAAVFKNMMKSTAQQRTRFLCLFCCT